MELTLKDKVAVVTGAGGGIGVAYSRALAQAGARVVLADIDEQAAASAAKELEAEGFECIAVQADVADEASAAAMARAAIERFGGIDILVGQPLSDIPIDFWERVMRVNLTGALICIQAVLPAMKERGRGKIINQSSGAAFIPAGVYGVTKLGLVSLTVSLARELAPLDINVNAIAPGFVGTDAAARSQPEGFEDIVE